VNERLIGVDIGGTKCAVVLGSADGDVYERVAFPTRTDLGPGHALSAITDAVASLRALAEAEGLTIAAAGVSCGGPLDPERGVVLSPPNLPGWDRIDVTSPVAERAGAPVALRNDADAGALAEYRFGAARGARSIAFLTFGTGMGAGLILDGRLYSGASSLAGEIGHVRIAETGPDNYGKAGSFEGYCSGSGIAALAHGMAGDRAAKGEAPGWYRGADRERITTADLAREAARGDRLALEVFTISGRYLGRGIAMLIDLLDLDCIVIGSVFVRCRAFLEPAMIAEIEREALPGALDRCRIVGAGLGERIGDVASLCVAMEAR
jgi:glucokinase